MESEIIPQGWIKLHRKLQQKGFYKKSEYVHLWVHLLLNANREEKEFMWNNNIIVIKKGQLLTGRESLAKATGINPSTIENILRMFENEHQIEQQKTTKYRVITVLNWCEYQTTNNKINNRVTTEEQQSNNRVTQTRSNKNEKNQENQENVRTLENIIAYGLEISLEKTECEKFFDHFESNGWKVGGKTPMKSWKAALRNWKRNSENFKGQSNGTTGKRNQSDASRRATFTHTEQHIKENQELLETLRKRDAEWFQRTGVDNVAPDNAGKSS